jgi:hypothetical protein
LENPSRGIRNNKGLENGVPGVLTVIMVVKITVNTVMPGI